MKNLNDLFDWHRNKNTKSVWNDNIIRLGDAVRDSKYVNFKMEFPTNR